MTAPSSRWRIAVVIPCYRVREHILGVLAAIGPACTAIYVVDDGCPDGSGGLVEEHCSDPRVRVIRHEHNQGVGAAVLTGYQAALADEADVIVKIDGDGQMDPADLPKLVSPIVEGEADYAKGNRFYNLARIRQMPTARIIGNAALSFITKFSTGYWDVFDPTNGYTAIHADAARQLPFARISTGYFFESDMLHQLGLAAAVVRDVPLDARYGSEKSGVSLLGSTIRFSVKHARNALRRLFYQYLLRDFSAASFELLLGAGLVTFGVVFGASQWVEWTERGVGAYAGTVMLAALPVIIGTQLLLAFLSFDVARMPRTPLHPQIRRRREAEAAIRAVVSESAQS